MRCLLPVLTLFFVVVGVAQAEIIIIQTAKNGDRQREVVPLEAVGTQDVVLVVDTDNPHQELAGFGASFTESSAWNLACLPGSARYAVLEGMFSPEVGLGFSLMRTHINSCDYSLRHYTYVDENDLALETFTIDEDRAGFTGQENDQVRGIKIKDPAYDLLPMIEEARSVEGADFRTIASPWSPPSWMKVGEHAEMTGGSLRRDVDKNGRLIYYEAWAQYLVKYIEAYGEAGVPLWAITPQNEPGHADHARWDTCYWSAEWQREFIADYLGPAMEAAGLLNPGNLEAGVGIFTYDHNKADMLDFVPVVLDDPKAARYVRGIAIHWYAINMGGKQNFRGEELAELTRRYPDKPLLHTESSIDIHPDDPIGQYWDPENEDWTRGKFTPFSNYAIDIITDLNNGAIGYIEWCMVLSTTGGPNPYDNFNSAPILVDPVGGQVLYTPLYYLLGHFSRFMRPGAVRLDVGGDLPSGVHATAAKNPDGSVAVAIFNDQEGPLTVAIDMEGEVIRTTVAGDGIQTVYVTP